MIDKKVVLVLGAGASYGYGFPLGYQLIKRVTQCAADGESQILTQGFHRDLLDEFAHALPRAQVGSIDEFLETREDLRILGKVLIAYVLCKCKIEGNLYAGAKEDWVQHLLRFMRTSNLQEFAENQLTVVTYNYDRSFDLLLYNHLKQKFKKDDDEVRDVLKHIPIIHVHGQLGRLPHQAEEIDHYREFETNVDTATLALATNGVKVIYEEDVKDNPEYAEAHAAIRQAEQVVFLGFGYHDINVNRLRLPECCARPEKATLVGLSGTAFELTPDEMERVKRQFRRPNPRGKTGIVLYPQTCTEFLRNNHTHFMHPKPNPAYPSEEALNAAAVQGTQ